MITFPATLNGTPSGVTGFTSPTWTTAASSTTFPNGKGAVVTAKGGTQPSAVDVHSASRPFSFLATKPPVIRLLPPVNAAGVLPSVPNNVYHVATQKGVTVLVGQPSARLTIDSSLKVPAGCDVADPDNVAAAILAHAMMLIQLAQGVVDTAKTGEI